MDFLVESQRRNKKWILLRQLLLLMLRTAAVALVVLMLAGPVLQYQWGQLIGNGMTHHLLLLDDSYSMSDRHDQTTVFDEAKRVVNLILQQSAIQSDNQKITLLRFSEAQRLSAGAELEVGGRQLDRKLVDEIQSRLEKMRHSESDAGPLDVIEAALGLPEPEKGEARIVYLMSDFRSRQWEESQQIRQSLGELRDQSAQLHLVQCVRQFRPNIAITHLEPESGIRAAGVETWFQVSVANYDNVPAAAVHLGITQDGHKLPAVQFEKIAPGEEISRRFRVTFPTAGAHQLQASLESDTVEADNVHYFACQVPKNFPVLLIDGSRQGDDGYYLRLALNPGGATKPGWSPQVERPSFLRQHERLNDFAAICLLDVPRLDEAEVAALENYVRQGGGLGLFLGPSVQQPFYNERLFRDGQGLLPAPLERPTQMLSDGDRATPDVVVTDHPLFHVFKGQRNSFLSVAKVNFYYALDSSWRIPEDGATQILARLQNGAPFVVEKKFGAGRIITQFVKLSPKPTELGSWSNWSLNPVFPVYANELVGYLSASRREFESHDIGDELKLELSVADYEPEIRVQLPRTLVHEETTLTPNDNDGKYLVDAGRSEVSGVWQFELLPREGDPERRLMAVNVAIGEGDLHHLDRADLAQRLKGVDYEFSLASQMTTSNDQLAGFRLSDTMLYLLLAALILEQWLAYRASYHTQVTRK